MIGNKTRLILAKLLITLILFIWLLPNYESIDVVASQWFHLGIINFLSLGFIYLTNPHKKLNKFFFNVPQLLLTGLFLWAIGSYFYAENRVEVLIESARLLTYVVLLFVLHTIIKRFSISFKFLALVFTISLLFETFIVLFNTILEHQTLLGLSRNQINNGIAANINITSFSILYKIPFAIYLISFKQTKILKVLISILISISFFTIFLLGTRSAIISSFLIIFFSFLFNFIDSRNIIKSFKKSLILIFPILIALLFSELFSQISNIDNSATDRLETIQLNNIQDNSIKQRLTYYDLSIKEFISNPLTGMGFGNWKINSIPYTLTQRSTYIVAYHAHNDFLQILAELGIIGFLLYSCFFISILYILFKSYRNKKISLEKTICIILFAIIYFIDANFNFPQARVIIQINLFLVIAYILNKGSGKEFKNNMFSFVLFILVILTSVSTYSNYRVLNSFIQQKKIYLDFNSQKRTIPIDEVLSFESSYPNISTSCLPLKALKANYLIDGANQDLPKAISMIKAGIRDNSYISYGQTLLSQVYLKIGNIDSSKYFAKQAYYNVPSIEFHVANYLPYVKNERDTVELDKMKTALLNSNSLFIWKNYIETLLSLKDSLLDSEKKLLQVASDRFPEFNYLKNLNLLKNYKTDQLLKAKLISDEAENLFKEKKYSKAAILYEKANSLIPEEPAYIENQARAYMLNKEYNQSIDLFKKLILEYNNNTGEPEFYIGVMYIAIGEKDKGCNWLTSSVNKGYYPSKTFSNQTCL